MLGVLFASPYYLDPVVDPQKDRVRASQRVQQARQAIHARHQSEQPSTNKQSTHHQHSHSGYGIVSSESPSQQQLQQQQSRPTMTQRRASLQYHRSGEHEDATLASGAIPETFTTAHPHLTGPNKLQLSTSDEIDIPYALNSSTRKEDEDESSTKTYETIFDEKMSLPQEQLLHPNNTASTSNGLPHIDLSSPLISLSQPRELSKMCRAGFATEQRRDVWPRLLVLPSTTVQVDVAAYYQALEHVFHLKPGHLTDHLEKEDEPFMDTNTVEAQEKALHDALPTLFPSAPLLGRSEEFDWHTLAMNREEHEIQAQKRVLCTICATNELSYAPQLPALVAIVYNAIGGDEARTHAFVSAMLDRSKRDEQFLVLSPVSMELLALGFRRSVQRNLPELEKHILKTGFNITGWFRSHLQDCFLSSHIPREGILRIWDVAIHTGMATANIKFAMALLHRFEPYLLSGSGQDQNEIGEKLAKLLNAVNLTSLFGANVWKNDNYAWYSKSDLTRLTTPTKETMLVIPENSTLLTGNYRVPRIVGSENELRDITEDNSNEQLMTLKICYQLYSGILTPPASRLNPACIYSSAREGHSLRNMMETVSQHPTSATAGALFLIQTGSAQHHKKFGVYFESFPKIDGAAGSSQLTELSIGGKSGFVCWFDEKKEKLNVQRFVGAPVFVTTMANNLHVPAATLHESSSNDSDDFSTASLGLPTLPVEGGPLSSRRSSNTVTIESVPPSFKRRGSLAVILDALHLKKTNEEGMNGNSEVANQLLAEVAPLSPFKHQVRIVNSPQEIPATSGGDGSHPSSRASSPVPSSRPLSPVLPPGTSRRVSNSGTHTTANASQASSSGSTPGLSRRQSIVQSLEKVWSFIDRVPSPGVTTALTPASTNVSTNVSPALSRRASVTGTAASSPRPAAAQRSTSVFFPQRGPTALTSSAPTSLAASPRQTARRKVAVSNRQKSMPLGSLPPRSTTSSGSQSVFSEHSTAATVNSEPSPKASPRVSFMRQRSMTMTVSPTERPIAESTEPQHPSAQQHQPPSKARITLTVPATPECKRDTEDPSSIFTPMSSDTQHQQLPKLRRAYTTPSKRQQHDSPSDRSRTPESGNNHNNASPPPASPSLPLQSPSFQSTASAFRQQSRFHLTVEDLEDQSQHHSDTVRSVIERVKSLDLETELPTTPTTSLTVSAPIPHLTSAPVGTATLYLSSHGLVLADLSPHMNLIFSLNDTLEEGTFQCEGITHNNTENGEENAIECDQVEAWVWQ